MADGSVQAYVVQEEYEPGDTFQEPFVHVELIAEQPVDFGTEFELYDVHVPPLAVVPQALEVHEAADWTEHDEYDPGAMFHEPFVQVEVIALQVEPYGTVLELYDVHVPPLGVVPQALEVQLDGDWTEHDEYEYGATSHEPFVHVDVSDVHDEPYGTLFDWYDVHVLPLGVVPQAEDVQLDGAQAVRVTFGAPLFTSDSHSLDVFVGTKSDDELWFVTTRQVPHSSI